MYKCDFCDHELTKIYTPINSLRGAVVFECERCGLIQTKYHSEYLSPKKLSISCDASWGNIRHGKSIRLEHSLNILKRVVNPTIISDVLDIGSNRGHFVNHILNDPFFNIKHIDAVEPDFSILDDYVKDDRLNLICSRLEYIVPNKYDLIYCCHTLEHLPSVRSALNVIYESLNDGGYVYIEVPNIDVILKSNNVEEFFIDKHTFHFSYFTLHQLLEKSGLDVLYYDVDTYNISIICTKHITTTIWASIIDDYSQTLLVNRLKLISVGQKINNLSSHHSVVLYGGSKIFNALVQYGKLNTKQIRYVIDDFLAPYIKEMHDVPITSLNEIRNDNIEELIILARSSTPTIMKNINDAKNINVQNIITFDELI